MIPRHQPRGGGRMQARSPGLLAGATLTDGNGIISSAVDVSNGWRITLTGPAVGRDLPAAAGAASGAVFAWPGIVALDGELLATLNPLTAGLRMRLVETLYPGDASRIRVAYGIMNSASPLTATSGVLWGLDYPGTNLRRTLVLGCTGTGTWAATTAGTGQADCLAVDGTYVIGTAGAIDEVNGYPFDQTEAPNAVGSNRAQRTATLTIGDCTHTALFIGWENSAGVNLSVLGIRGKHWAHDSPEAA